MWKFVFPCMLKPTPFPAQIWKSEHTMRGNGDVWQLGAKWLFPFPLFPELLAVWSRQRLRRVAAHSIIPRAVLCSVGTTAVLISTLWNLLLHKWFYYYFFLPGLTDASHVIAVCSETSCSFHDLVCRFHLLGKPRASSCSFRGTLCLLHWGKRRWAVPPTSAFWQDSIAGGFLPYSAAVGC